MKGVKKLLPIAIGTFISCWPTVPAVSAAEETAVADTKTTSENKGSTGAQAQMSPEPPAKISPTTTEPLSSSAKTEPMQTSNTPAKSPASAAVINDIQSAEVVHGPLEDKRLALRNKITAAKKQGIGISVYTVEFSRIEDLVKQGGDPAAIQKRVDSLSSNLDEQMKRSQILKTQRPVPPSSIQAAHDGSSAQSHGGSGMDAVLKKLKEKYGDQIPSNIDPETRDKFLHSDAAKELLKKFRGSE